MAQIKIVCGKDPWDRKVYSNNNGEWVEIKDVTMVQIEPILPSEPIKAQIEVLDVELEIVAEEGAC